MSQTKERNFPSKEQRQQEREERLSEAYELSPFVDIFYSNMGFIYSTKAWTRNNVLDPIKEYTSKIFRKKDL